MSVIHCHRRGRRLGQHFPGNVRHLLGINISRHAQHHISGPVKGPMALIQGVRRDAGDRLHRPCYPVSHGMADVHGFQQTIVHLVVRVVLAHADLLRDDALFLINALWRKPGNRHKGQQHTQVFLKAPHAVKIIARHGRGGKSIGIHPVGSHALKGVAILCVKGFVLQEVGYPRRGRQPLPILSPKPQIHPAVPGGKKGELLGVFRPHIHINAQPVGQCAVINTLAQGTVFQLVHRLTPPSPSDDKRCPASALGRPLSPDPPSPTPPP